MIFSFLKSSFRKLTASCMMLLFVCMPSVWIMSSAQAAQDDIGLRIPQSQEIAPDDFLASDASRYFQSGNYEKALVALNQLEKSFPKDELIQRYRAMTLDRLGKSKEAIEIFKTLLVKNPSHVPTHYFLGQAYARSGLYDDAAREWKQVAKDGEGTPYAFWAESALQQTQKFEVPAEKTAEKVQRWYIQARYGYEYDSNVILKPEDQTLSTAKDQDAGRHSLDLAIRYRLLSRRDTAVDLTYAGRQSLHDDHFEDFNYHSEEFGLNFRQRTQIGSQDVVWGLRYEYLLGFLSTDLYSQRNRWHISADTRFTEHTQTIFYDRITVSNYGPDGFNPPQTSRDGFENDTGFTHFFYNHDFQRYLFLRGEFNTAATRGDNFDSLGYTTRIGYHTPVPKLEKLSFDASTGLEQHFYPGFTSTSSLDTSRRRDVTWDLYTSLTYALTKSFAVRGFYRYVNGENQNNLYNYERHIGGFQIIYSRTA